MQTEVPAPRAEPCLRVPGLDHVVNVGQVNGSSAVTSVDTPEEEPGWGGRGN